MNGVVPKTVYECKGLNPRPLYYESVVIVCVQSVTTVHRKCPISYFVLRDRNVLIGVVLVYCMMTHNDSSDAHTKCA